MPEIKKSFQWGCLKIEQKIIAVATEALFPF